jgi:hypothetical protein
MAYFHGWSDAELGQGENDSVGLKSEIRFINFEVAGDVNIDETPLKVGADDQVQKEAPETAQYTDSE